MAEIAMSHNAFLVEPKNHSQGEVYLPGSKSISNRVLLLSALAKGNTRLIGLLDADDTRVMRDALLTLGVQLSTLTQDNLEQLVIEGTGGQFSVRQADLFMGNAGTAIRPLTAALAILGGEYTLHGVPRMHERPIADLVDGLLAMGAQIHYSENKGYPPIRIQSGKIDLTKQVRVRGDVSSQYLTALLMALPLLRSPTPIRIEVLGELISKPYIAITTNLMAKFGVHVENNQWQSFTIPAHTDSTVGPYSSPGNFVVEGDASSASYFLALGALGNGPVIVRGAGRDSIQGDIAFARALSMMGANVTMGSDWIEVKGVETDDGRLRGIDLDCTEIPDAAMTLAVLGMFASGKTRLSGIASWRVKETDRIAAMVKELRKFGAAVSYGEDFIEVSAPQTWMIPDGGVDTYDDHRMAMCFSLAVFNPNPYFINHPECVSKTFPHYFAQWGKLLRQAL
jgi:3-phosphoshikimate 1-carboxyvinyltransferase